MSEQTSTTPGLIVLDDGDYSIELNPAFPEADAPALLRRQCYFGVTTPEGLEYIGAVDRTGDGLWCVTLNQRYDPRTDSDTLVVGIYKARVYAIVALWRTRHMAHCRHAE